MNIRPDLLDKMSAKRIEIVPLTSDHDVSGSHIYRKVNDDCRLTPLTDELAVTVPSVSPKGKFPNYFINEAELGGGPKEEERA